MSDRWSHSRVTSFEQCPRKYEYNYVERRKESFDSVEGFMGGIVHDTIEHLFVGRALGIECTLQEAIGFYADAWIGELTDKVKVIRADDSLEKEYEAGRKIIEKFYPRFYSDPMRTMAIECEVSCDLVYRPDKVSHQTFAYRGFIDRLARAAAPAPFTGDILCVIDYKTSKHMPRKFEGKEADQLRSYALCLMRSDPTIDNVYLIADFVRTGETKTGIVTRDNMAQIESLLARRVASAAAARQFPAIPSKLCDWCGHNDVCKARETGEGSPF